jgi:hypothetical protein
MTRMSRYYNYSSNSYGSNWKTYVGPVRLGLVVVLFIVWAIMEFACSRTFVGTLVSREAPITFTYDEEQGCLGIPKLIDAMAAWGVKPRGARRMDRVFIAGIFVGAVRKEAETEPRGNRAFPVHAVRRR